MPASAWHGSDQTERLRFRRRGAAQWSTPISPYAPGEHAQNTWPFLRLSQMLIYYSTRTRCRPDLGPVWSVVSCRVGSVTVSGRRHGGWAEHLRLLKDSGQGDGRAHGMRGYRPLLPRATQLGKKAGVPGKPAFLSKFEFSRRLLASHSHEQKRVIAD